MTPTQPQPGNAGSAVGLTFRERFQGAIHFDERNPEMARGRISERRDLVLSVTVEIPDIDDFIGGRPEAELRGLLEHPTLEGPLCGKDGKFRIERRSELETRIVYEISVDWRGEPHRLIVEKILRDDPGPDLLKDLITAPTRLFRGANGEGGVVAAGNLELGSKGLVDVLASIEVKGAPTLAARARAIQKFGAFFLGRLWQVYGHLVP